MKDNLVECLIEVHNLDTEKEHLEHELKVIILFIATNELIYD